MTVNHDPVLETGGGGFGYEPRFPLREGLRDFVDWLAAHRV